jgi:hypothetical protein
MVKCRKRGKRDRSCEESNAGSNIVLTVKSNAKSNGRVRARGKRKCYSYSVGCATIRYSIKTTTVTAITRTLVCKLRDCSDS